MKKLILVLLFVPLISLGQIINTKIYDEKGIYFGIELYDSSSNHVVKKHKEGIIKSIAILQKYFGMLMIRIEAYILNMDLRE